MLASDLVSVASTRALPGSPCTLFSAGATVSLRLAQRGQGTLGSPTQHSAESCHGAPESRAAGGGGEVECGPLAKTTAPCRTHWHLAVRGGPHAASRDLRHPAADRPSVQRQPHRPLRTRQCGAHAEIPSRRCPSIALWRNARARSAFAARVRIPFTTPRMMRTDTREAAIWMRACLRRGGVRPRGRAAWRTPRWWGHSCFGGRQWQVE